MEQSHNELAKKLALVLIYLSAWKEKDTDEYRAWKGYDFGILDALKDDGYIDFSYKAKSLYLSGEGVEKSKELIEKFASVYL